MPRIDLPLFALGPFTSGAMLLWGLAAAVPIILHLLNRRRRQTVAFAAMQFLLAASSRRSRRMRLWQWLLLLARVAAVLLIAAALADPILGERRSDDGADTAPTLHVLVVDASYSMQAVSGEADVRVWDLALQAAIDRVDGAAAGDAFCLVRMSDPVLPIIIRPVRDARAVRRELQRMQPTDSGASLPATLAVVEQLIRDIRQHDRVYADNIQVVIFSDMQRVTWTSIVQAAGRSAWDALSAVAVVDVVPVARQDPPSNLTVVDARLASGLIAAGQTVELEAEIRRSGAAVPASEAATEDGNSATSETRVQLKRDGQVLASADLPSINVAGSASAMLGTRLSAGETALEVEVGGDALTADNRRWLPLAVPQTLRVVCVGADQTTRYLAAAVAPRRDGPIEVRAVTPDRLHSLSAAEIDVLMLCDLREPTPDVMALVDRTAHSGAGVVWWLGASVDAAAYNRAAQPDGLASLPVLPARVAAEGLYAVDPRAYGHPIAAPFEAHPQSGLLSTPLFRYWTVTPSEALPGGCEVALAVGEQGDPLLLTCETETHRIAVFTTPPSAGGGVSVDTAAPWNALVAWPSFVPLVQETLRWVLTPRLRRPSLLVGEPLAGTVPKPLGRPTQLTMPDQSQRPLTDVVELEGRWRWRAGMALQPGVQWLQTESGHRRVLVVNVDPREGDLDRFAAAVPALTQQRHNPAGGGAEIATDGGAGDRWFRLLLAAAIGLLAAESVISRVVLGRERYK